MDTHKSGWICLLAVPFLDRCRGDSLKLFQDNNEPCLVILTKFRWFQTKPRFRFVRRLSSGYWTIYTFQLHLLWPLYWNSVVQVMSITVSTRFLACCSCQPYSSTFAGALTKPVLINGSYGIFWVLQVASNH